MSALDDYLYRPIAEPIAFDGGLLLVDQGCPLATLEGTAVFFWHLIANGTSHKEAMVALAQRFDKSKQRIEADFEPLVQRWLDLGLIEKEKAEPLPASIAILDNIVQIGDDPVRLRCHVASCAAKIDALYQPARVGRASDAVWTLDFCEDRKSYIIARNDKIVLRDQDQGSARGGLLVECLRLSAPDRQWLACLHASAVSDRNSCLIFSGACGAGKTTLTLGMLHAGYQLIADDMLPIDREEHLLWPLPFAMSLKEGVFDLAQTMFAETKNLLALSTDRGPVRYFFPKDQARPWKEGGLPVTALIFLRFEKGAELVLERVDRSFALQELVKNGSSIDLTGFHLGSFLSWLQTIPCYSLHYGDLDVAVRRLKNLF